MAKTSELLVGKWDTLHENGAFDLKRQYITRHEHKATMPSRVLRYNDAAEEIQRLIKKCETENEGFRAYGSRWSMSKIAHQKDNMHQNNLMYLDLEIEESDMHPDSEYAHENIFFFECGNTIKRISQKLNEYGKSLKTTGASNGQTIAGCISTGVHGSAFDMGAVQDYVVGLNIITGPNATDNVYLERHTKPSLNDAFAHSINARVIRNDELFNAALVGLGSFGFIHGVALEAEDLFLLDRYVRRIDKDLALSLSKTLDFKNSEFKIDNEIDENGKPSRPNHYKIFINPYVDEDKYVVEAMYKKKYTLAYPDPFTKIEKSLYKDLIYLLIKFSEKFPKSIPWFIKSLQKSILPEITKDEEKIRATLYETFWDAGYKGPAFACSMGVAIEDSERALNVLVKMTKAHPIPGIFAMRYVNKSEGTLAFTKFHKTCVIEIDGIQWNKSDKIPSLKEYGTFMIEAMQAENIPFTVHWGKSMDYAFPNLANHMYGNNVEKWTKCRSWLLSEKMANIFSNEFITTLGLEAYQNVPNDFIESLDKSGQPLHLIA